MHIRPSLRNALLAASLVLCALSPSVALGKELYVSPSGSDAAAGTLDAPFATIAHATSVMEGGDTLYLRAGTYRESVTHVPSGTEARPTTIAAYNGEEVWISGGDLVSGWTSAGANLWSAPMPWDMRDVNERDLIDGGAGATSTLTYDNMVRVGGAAAPEGRWPNATVAQYLDRDTYGRVDVNTRDGDVRTIADDDIPENVDFTGGTVWVAPGGGYLTQLALVTGHEQAAHRLSLKPLSATGGFSYGLAKGNYFYVYDCLDVLDQQNEWYKDHEGGKLYLWSATDPNATEVEAARRNYAIRLNDVSHVTFRGVNVRLGCVRFDEGASHVTFTQAKLEQLDRRWDNLTRGQSTGVLLDGSHNTVSRCEIAYCAGSGAELRGTRNKVVNNHIHDCGYEHDESSLAVEIYGSEHLVSHNTIHRLLRGAVGGDFERSVISYNDMYDCMRVSRDGGALYFNNHDYDNSEIHHNLIHDTLDFPDDEQQVGLYFDSFTSSMVVYRNVVWGIQKSDEANSRNGRHLTYQMNPNSLNNVMVNNTFVNFRPLHLNFYPNQDWTGTVWLNNVFQTLSFIDGPRYAPWNYLLNGEERDIIGAMGAVWADNIEGKFVGNTGRSYSLVDVFKDPGSNDYTLKDGAEAIDAGRVIDGVTDGYAGEAPDLGAYEYGQPTWKAGCDLAREIDEPYALNDRIPFRNLLRNHSFEDWEPTDLIPGSTTDRVADFAEWGQAGVPQRLEMSAWGYWGRFSKDGVVALKLTTSSDRLTQHVGGLRPYTAYRVGGFGYVTGELITSARLTQAYTDASATTPVDASKLRSLQRSSGMSLSGVKVLEYDDVDFGSGRDRLILGHKGSAVGQKTRVALGTPGNVVGTFERTTALTTAAMNSWWDTVELDRSYSGKQKVYLIYDGDFSSVSLMGVIPDRSESDDAVVVTATSDTGQKAQATITSAYKPFESYYTKATQATVITGPKGELDVEVAKRGDELVGYLDEVFLSEDPEAWIL